MKPIPLFLALLFAAANLHAADQPSAAELRMREALRNTMLQLRTAQNDAAVLQTAKAELEKKGHDQDAQIKLLTQHAEEDRQAAAKKAESQGAQIAELTRTLEETKAAYAKCRADLEAAKVLARNTEGARKQLEGAKIVLDRTVADQRTKNAELFKLGKDILLRYEKFGLGEALGAKEPFVGTTRVKLESYVQDFQDKLTDQKIKP